MTVKINLRILTKNRASDPEIGYLTKSISKPKGRLTGMPTAWELTTSFGNSKDALVVVSGEFRLSDCEALAAFNMIKKMFIHRKATFWKTQREIKQNSYH